MNVLVFGAGVIGSVFAAKIHRAGARVTVLARGGRLDEIRNHGIVIRHGITGCTESFRPDLIESLDPGQPFDLALVPIRAEQVPDALQSLAANDRIPAVVMMVNHTEGSTRMARALGPERTLLGFAGVGGGKAGHVVEYAQAPGWIQTAVVGECDGRVTERLRRIAGLWAAAGLPTALEPHMGAWLRSHAAWVVPFALSLMTVDCRTDRLARDPEILDLTIRAIREGIAALDALWVPLRPARLRLLDKIPKRILTGLLRHAVRRPSVDLLAVRHVRAAPREILALSASLRALVGRAQVRAPALDFLARQAEMNLESEPLRVSAPPAFDAKASKGVPGSA